MRSPASLSSAGVARGVRRRCGAWGWVSVWSGPSLPRAARGGSMRRAPASPPTSSSAAFCSGSPGGTANRTKTSPCRTRFTTSASERGLLELDGQVLFHVQQRDEEVHSDGSGGGRDPGRGHSDRVASGIQQRAPAAAREHADVALDVVNLLERPQAADHALGDRELELRREGSADREDLAPLQDLFAPK